MGQIFPTPRNLLRLLIGYLKMLPAIIAVYVLFLLKRVAERVLDRLR